MSCCENLFVFALQDENPQVDHTCAVKEYDRSAADKVSFLLVLFMSDSRANHIHFFQIMISDYLSTYTN